MSADYFKSINDIQGHAAGDAALRDVAETISTHLRGGATRAAMAATRVPLSSSPRPLCNIALSVTERLNQCGQQPQSHLAEPCR